jgi:hypothetical protein
MVDEKGAHLGSFAGIGEGPGRVPHPICYEIYIFDNELYLSTKAKTLIYSLDGDYHRERRAPPRFRMRKVEGGWILYDIEEGVWLTPATVKWVGDASDIEKDLYRWDREEKNQNFLVRDVGMIAFSRDGKRMFVRKPGSFEVRILDTGTLRETGVIEKDLPKALIGDEQIEKLKKMARRPRDRKIPEYYPAMSDMFLQYHYLLIVRFIQNQRPQKFFFDIQGNEQTPEQSHKLLFHLLEVENELAWLNLFDKKEEQVVLAQWPVDGLQERLDAWLEDHGEPAP